MWVGGKSVDQGDRGGGFTESHCWSCREWRHLGREGRGWGAGVGGTQTNHLPGSGRSGWPQGEMLPYCGREPKSAPSGESVGQAALGRVGAHGRFPESQEGDGTLREEAEDWGHFLVTP